MDLLAPHMAKVRLEPAFSDEKTAGDPLPTVPEPDIALPPDIAEQADL